jgi:putative oxygen-independent coproporphyrinogen III oxidase
MSSQALSPRVTGTVPGSPATSVAGIRALYVHIPFCERKCEYCDFTSVAGLRGESAYMEALGREIRMLSAQFPGVVLDTVFVGGGTPSLVDPERLASVMDDILTGFTLAEGAEITLEANPSSTSRERAVRWRAAGFNRVSLGVQSLEPDVLTFLGRVHDAGRALAAVDEVHAAGFESVNCDLIYGVPGLDDRRWTATVQRVIDAGPTHVSCYELTVEPATPLHRSVRLGTVTPVAGEVALRQHRIAVDQLSAAGLTQYEVSNFARPGARCRHNLVYWANGYYLAAGVGAHGHVPSDTAGALGLSAGADDVAVRHWHGRGITAYTSAVDAGRFPIQDHEAVGAATHEQERLMLGLRLNDGVVVKHPAARREAEVLARAGLVVISGDRIRVSRRGEDVLNAVALRLTDALAA